MVSNNVRMKNERKKRLRRKLRPYFGTPPLVAVSDLRKLSCLYPHHVGKQMYSTSNGATSRRKWSLELGRCFNLAPQLWCLYMTLQKRHSYICYSISLKVVLMISTNIPGRLKWNLKPVHLEWGKLHTNISSICYPLVTGTVWLFWTNVSFEGSPTSTSLVWSDIPRKCWRICQPFQRLCVFFLSWVFV